MPSSLSRDLADPLANPLDALLIDIAVNIQLPPSLHAKAEQRYAAVRSHAERADSPLKDRIGFFYPQGSMGIDATTSTRGTDDEYDLDVVAELLLNHLVSPEEALSLLFEALKDYPVDKVIRQTRCITLKYSDRMHVDLTPSVRLPFGGDRESHIFHANPDEAAAYHYHVPMNAWGFRNWYRQRTPIEQRFAIAANRRLHEAFGDLIKADAEVEDVPKQTPFLIKSVTTVALQLLKRFRNIIYAHATGRIPPSVMLSCLAGEVARPGMMLSDMLIVLARHVVMRIRAASSQRQRVSVLNPVYAPDCFTDRWPENQSQQDEFAARLAELADGLAHFKAYGADLEQMQEWLREKFGSHVVSRSVRQFNARLGQGVRDARVSYSRPGGIYVPSAPAIIGIGGAAAASAPAVARAHTHMGGRRR